MVSRCLHVPHMLRAFVLCVYICNVYLDRAMGGLIVQDLEELP